MLLINDVTPELLSPDRRGNGTIVSIMQDCDKKVDKNNFAIKRFEDF